MKNKVSKIIFYYHSAITCAAPTITDGNDNCDDPTAWNGQCVATCNAGFHMTGSATMTCNGDNADGSGSFDGTPTCAGIPILIQ